MSYTRNGMVLYRTAALGAVAGRSHTDSTRGVDLIVALDRSTVNIPRALYSGF
jgi:hypothetical protein